MIKEKCYGNEKLTKIAFWLLQSRKKPQVFKNCKIFYYEAKSFLLGHKVQRGPVSHKHTPCSLLTTNPSHLNRQWALLVMLLVLRSRNKSNILRKPSLGYSLKSVTFSKQKLKFQILRCNYQETGIWMNALNILCLLYSKDLPFLIL